MFWETFLLTKHRPNRRPNFSMLYSTKKTYRNKNGVGAFPMGMSLKQEKPPRLRGLFLNPSQQ
jgi:hypothetical protein